MITIKNLYYRKKIFRARSGDGPGPCSKCGSLLGMTQIIRYINAKHTKSCRSESCPAIPHTSVTSNFSGISSFSTQKNVWLVTRDFHIFLINPLFHIDNCFIIAIVWSKVDSISDGGEVSSSICSHSQHLARVISNPSPTLLISLKSTLEHPCP